METKPSDGVGLRTRGESPTSNYWRPSHGSLQVESARRLLWHRAKRKAADVLGGRGKCLLRGQWLPAKYRVLRKILSVSRKDLLRRVYLRAKRYMLRHWLYAFGSCLLRVDPRERFSALLPSRLHLSCWRV
jgi:hypothetical protein